MKGKVNCTCGWSWNKSDSSAKDMYICHECGRDNSNNMKNGGWLDNYNDSQASAPEGMIGDGYSNVGRDYSPAWGGQFQKGGELPIAQEGLTPTIKKNKEEQGIEHFNKVKDWYNKYTNSPGYKENLSKSGYEDPQAIIDERLENINTTTFKNSESILGSYYRNNKINYSPIKDQENFPGDDPDSAFAHEFGHSSIDTGKNIFNGFEAGYNKYDFEQLKNRNKDPKNSRGEHENYADQKAIQYEAEKQGLYKAGYGEFTEDMLDKLKDSGLKKRALKNYSKKDLIWLLNNIAQTDGDANDMLAIAQEGGELPNAQKGKKVKYVESKNDPRYKAYNDSLSLYKTSLKNMWAEKNLNKSKVTKKGFIPFDEFKTFIPSSNLEYNDLNMYPGPAEDYKNKIKSTVVSKRKLNNLIQNNIKPIGFDINEWRGDVKGKPTLNYSTVYKKPEEEVIVQRPEIESLQQLAPLQTIGTQIEATPLPVIRPEAQIPKSYKLRTQRYTMNGPVEMDHLGYYNNQEASLEQLMKIQAEADAYNANIQKKYIDDLSNYNQIIQDRGKDRAGKLKMEVVATPNYQMGGKLKSNIPVIEDAGGYNEEGYWVPDWEAMTAQAKKLGAKRVKTKHGSLIVFDDNWEVIGVDDNPDAMQMGGNVYPVNYVPQAQDGEKTYSYPLRDKLYPGEDEYFKANPNVGGMAAEDNQVIINPYSPLSDEEKEAVRMNEVARLAMRNGYKRPTFDLTPEQQESFKDYSTDEQDIRETIIGRILSGDPSAKNVTPEQKKYAEELQKVLKYQTGGSIPGATGNMYARIGAPSNGPYAKKTMASAKDGGWLDGYDKAQGGTKVEYGTPEYEEAYNKGKVITNEGGRSPILLDEVVIPAKPLTEFGKTRKEIAAKNTWEQFGQRFLGNFEKNMGQTLENLPEYRKKEYEDYVNKLAFDEYIKTHPQAKGEDRGAYIDRMQAENANSSNFERAYEANADYNDATDVNKWRKGLIGLGSLVLPKPAMDYMKQESDYFSKKEKQAMIDNPISTQVGDVLGTIDPLSILVEGMYGEKSFGQIASGESADIPMSARILGDPMMLAFEAAPLIGSGFRTAGRLLGTEEGLLSNTWKINPSANKTNLPEVGEIIKHPFRDQFVPIENISDKVDYFHLNAAPDNIPQVAARDSEFWNKLNNDSRFFIKSTDNTPSAVIDMPIMGFEGKFPVPMSDINKYRSAENIKGNPHWWKGHQQIETPTPSLGSSVDNVTPTLYETNKAKLEIEKRNNNLLNLFNTPEGKRRLALLGVDNTKLNPPDFRFSSTGSNYFPKTNSLDIDIEEAIKLGIDPKTVYEHEIGHWLGKQYGDQSSTLLRQTFYETPIDIKFKASYPENYADDLLKENPNVDFNKISKETSGSYMLNEKGEPFPFLREMRQNMLNKGYIDNEFDDISEETINKFIKENPSYDRISSFTEPNSEQSKTIYELFKDMPVIVPGAIGLGAASQLEQKREGGIIKDDRGQWDHPGEITRIKGGNITMKRDPKTGKALTQPILGIADTGEEQWMYPGEDYNFEGANYVTEYPKGKKPRMAKNGLRQEQKGLVNLDNLLNFTNYNTKQPGGWLDTL